MNFFSLFIFIFLIPVFSYPEKAAFFIAKDPVNFDIFNRYQQKLSTKEKEKFNSNTPWKIINRNTLLGDQITHVMQVEQEGVLFYFVLNADGSFKGESTFFDIFEDCLVKNDQIKVVLEKGVLFREVPFSYKSDSPRVYLEEGVHLKRFFKKGSSYFVKNLHNNSYGWIRFNNDAAVATLMIKDKQKKQSSFNEILLKQLESKVNNINSVYLQLFNYLNTQYKQNRSIPFWDIVIEEKNITLNLKNAETSSLKKSTSYLINDIENIFSGENVFTISDIHSIRISLNNEN